MLEFIILYLSLIVHAGAVTDEICNMIGYICSCGSGLGLNLGLLLCLCLLSVVLDGLLSRISRFLVSLMGYQLAATLPNSFTPYLYLYNPYQNNKKTLTEFHK